MGVTEVLSVVNVVEVVKSILVLAEVISRGVSSLEIFPGVRGELHLIHSVFLVYNLVNNIKYFLVRIQWISPVADVFKQIIVACYFRLVGIV